MDNIYNLLFKNNENNKKIKNIGNLSDNTILNLASDINGLMNEFDKNIYNINFNFKEIEFPHIITIGMQSSGKTTVLESIIGTNILYKNENLSTRNPFNIKLIRNKDLTQDTSFIEFGNYTQFGWKCEKKFLYKDVIEIRKYIEIKTIEIAGNNYNISDIPIYIHIHAPNVPNLEFIDLPGIINISLTDKGQDPNIVNQIKNLLKKYITNSNSIVLLILQARTDLEVDSSLAFIKECGATDKTIAVLNKPDKMNDNSNISQYLLNNISKELKVKYGYYCIKNQVDSSPESELDYFNNHNEYKKDIYKNKLGYSNLINKLSEILISNIKDKLVNIIDAIYKLDNLVDVELNKLGHTKLNTKESKINEINNTINNYAFEFNNLLESNTNNFDINLGKYINDIFNLYRTNISKLNINYDNNYYNNLISNLQGYHMASKISPIQIIEYIFKNDSDIFNKLKDETLLCNNNICDKLLNISEYILSNCKYKDLNKELYNFILKYVSNIKNNNINIINLFINKEVNFIWTDNDIFTREIQNLDNNYNKLNNIVNIYYKTILNNFANNIPKFLFFSIMQFKKSIQNELYNHFINTNLDYSNLIIEDENIINKRNYFTNIKSRINYIKKNEIFN